MFKRTILILLVVFIAGCNPGLRTGRAEMFNDKNESQGYYTFKTNMPMLFKVVDGDVTIEADSRNNSVLGELFKGIVNMVTLGFVSNNK